MRFASSGANLGGGGSVRKVHSGSKDGVAAATEEAVTGSSSSSSSKMTRKAGRVPSPRGRRLAQEPQADPATPLPPPLLRSDAFEGLQASAAVLDPRPCWVLLHYRADVGDPRNRNGAQQQQQDAFKAYWRVTPLGDTVYTYKPIVVEFNSWALGWAFYAGEQLAYGGSDSSMFIDGMEMPLDTRAANIIGLVLNNGSQGGSIVRDFQTVTVLSNSTLQPVKGTLPFSFTLYGKKGPPAATGSNATGSASTAAYTTTSTNNSFTASLSDPGLQLDGPAFAPLRVAAPTNVFLNNLVCSMAQEVGDTASSVREAAAKEQSESGASYMPPPPRPPPPLIQTSQPQNLPAGGSNASRGLQVVYAPITALVAAGAVAAGGGGSSNTANATGAAGASAMPVFTPDPVTMMNITLTNEGNDEGISLQQIEVEYWFQGPNDTKAAVESEGGVGGHANSSSSGMASAPPPFAMKCLSTNPALRNGCKQLTGSFRRGLPGVPGAQYVLTLGFTSEPVFLVPPRGLFADEETRSQKYYYINGTHLEIGMAQVVLFIEPTDAVSKLDARQDYSYMDSPLSWTTPDVPGFGESAAADSVPTILSARVSLQNSRMPAYAVVDANRTLLWGAPPEAAASAAPQPPSSEWQQVPLDTGGLTELPPGSSCYWEADGSLSCSLESTYCCATNDTIVTDLPLAALSAVTAAATAASKAAGPTPASSPWSTKKAIAVAIGSSAAGLLVIFISAVLLVACQLHRRRPVSIRGRGDGGEDDDDDDHDGRDGGGGQELVAHLRQLQLQPPYRRLKAISMTQSEAGELQYLLDAGWWQDNCQIIAGGMAHQQLSRRLTVPPEAFKAHVEALSPPTTQERRELMLTISKAQRCPMQPASCSGGGGGCQRRDEAGVAAPLEAGQEADEHDLDSDIRLRLLLHKANSWSGHLETPVEPLPLDDDASLLPNPLLAPPEEPEPAELEPDACSVKQLLQAGSRRYMSWAKRKASTAPSVGGCSSIVAAPAVPGGPPVTLSLEPIELNVNFEAEVAPGLGRLIGEGGFGQVFEGVWRGRKVAVKTVIVGNETQRQALAKEAQIAARFRCCERVVQLLGASLGPDSINAATCSAIVRGISRRTVVSSGGGMDTIDSAAAGDSAGGGREADVTVAGGGTGTLHTVATSPGAPGDDVARSTRGGEAITSSCRDTAVNQAAVESSHGRSGQPPEGQPLLQQGYRGQQQQRCTALILELCEGGNLGDRIRNPRMRRLEFLEILQLSRDVAEALALLHRFGVLHRDLKPGNVLLDSKGRAKIADFGISRLRDPYRSCVNVTEPGGTINYMAPELFNGRRVDERADVYSLGCIMYEALTRKVPFEDLMRGHGMRPTARGVAAGGGGDVCARGGNPAAVIMAVAVLGKRPQLPDWVPRGLSGLISACWEEEPRSRPAAAQVYVRLDELMAEELSRRALRASWASVGGSQRAFAMGRQAAWQLPQGPPLLPSSGLPVSPPSPPPTPGLPSSSLAQTLSSLGSQAPASLGSGAGGGRGSRGSKIASAAALKRPQPPEPIPGGLGIPTTVSTSPPVFALPDPDPAAAAFSSPSDLAVLAPAGQWQWPASPPAALATPAPSQEL